MVETNSDIKSLGIAINLQRLFNPLVEAATLRIQDPQSEIAKISIQNMNVRNYSLILLLIMINSLTKMYF